METKQNYIVLILVIGIVVIGATLAMNSKNKIVVGDTVQRDIVSVSGSSSLTVEPNKAEVYVKVVTLEKNAQDSKNKNSQTTNAVIAALKKEGIKESDIETSQFSIYPRYEYEEVVENDIRKSKQTLVGYETTNVLKVTTLDLDKAGKLIDVAVDSGANDVERVSFGLTKDKEKEVKRQAMVLAAGDAKEKASALANSLSVSLGKVTSISESGFYYQPFDYAAPRAMMKAGEESFDTVISPQKIDVSANVNVIYEIG